ncbi:hypothetical protein L596_003402 [Steinernema carpocapsae]|uniref:Probable enoyl-CoA hydratase, mitochondrial n=1 Tax=Steinernema carpocapsae TaxID=34508 RepID=A0A4U8USG9_STECR|nr:hypothetical protein L596_003402 [Steinernema carpocapsae]
MSSENGTASSPDLVLLSLHGDKRNVALLTLNRPKVLNALCSELMDELQMKADQCDADDSIGAIVITGSQESFAAGADISELSDRTFSEMVSQNFLHNWDFISNTRTPVIAAVNGFALGGGCELALMCDVIYAGEKALFGQPEINIGTIPGAGGTQRWTRIAGKSLTMELCLTGDKIGALEAKECGLVSKVFPVDQVVREALKLGERIASKSRLITLMVKEAINCAYETSLHEGLQQERRLFHSTFATEDRKEGMFAFAEKRTPKWTGK